MANDQSPTGNPPTNTFNSAGVVAGSRRYRFAVKTNRAGQRYLVITEESSNNNPHVRKRVVVFQRHMQKFRKAFLKSAKQVEPKLKAFDVEKIRETYPNAYRPWRPDDDQRLIAKFKEGLDVIELAKLFQRGPGGIQSRLQLLGLVSIQNPPGQAGLRQT